MLEHKYNFQNSASAGITCIYYMSHQYLFIARGEISNLDYGGFYEEIKYFHSEVAPSHCFEVTSLCTEVSSQVPSPKLSSEQS